MKALLIALTICVGAAAYAAEPVPPAAVTGQQIAHYRAAMQNALADLKVSVREVTLRNSTLVVSYEDCNEQESHAFITGAVLTLAAPLATGSETICVRAFSGKRKLSEISVAPGDACSIYAAELGEGEAQRLQELAARTLAAAGLSTAPPVGVSPVVSAAPAGSTSVTLVSPSPAQPKVTLAESEHKHLAEKLLRALSAAKLENITIAVDDCGGWYVDFENRSYRSDVEALAAGLRVIAQSLPPVQLTVTVKRDEVPVSRVCLYLGDYAAAQGELLASEELTRRWSVKSGAAAGPRRALAGGNSSRGKVDVALRPDVHYEIGNEADPFESDTFLLANADTTVARGWHANVQSATRLTSGLSSRIDRALLTKTGWLGRDWLATGSVGKFEEGFYGWYGELQWDQQEHRLGLVANNVSDSLQIGSDSRSQAFGYYEYEAGKLGLTARVGYGRFVDSNSNGALLSLQRRFGESVVAAEAVRGEGGAEALNFRLSVPLGPTVASSPSALRLRSDTAFKAEYMSNLALQGDYLQNGQDLASFRGELSAPYVEQQVSRVLGERGEDEIAAQWPTSQSHEGTSGLIRIPTADVIPDGTLLAGVSYMDAEHSRVVTATTDAIPVFVGIGLLPNLELVGKVTIFNDVTAFDWNVNTDRSFNAHYRLLQQRGNRPAVAIGAQDVTFGTTSSYLGKAEYVVGTWAAERYRLHLGWGKKRLDGPFGGVEYALRPDRRLQVMMDYDTEFCSLGLRGFVSKWVTLDVSLLGLSDLGGAVVFRTELK
jgi:hypothetical protein